jgi:hypothetical protein
MSIFSSTQFFINLPDHHHFWERFVLSIFSYSPCPSLSIKLRFYRTSSRGGGATISNVRRKGERVEGTRQLALVKKGQGGGEDGENNGQRK